MTLKISAENPHHTKKPPKMNKMLQIKRVLSSVKCSTSV